MLLLTAMTLSCQPTRNQETARTADTLSNSHIQSTTNVDNEESIDNSPQPKAFDQFEMTFESENTEYNSRQTLGVTWLTKDSIEFRLLSEDDLCDTDYWGNAKNNYADMDPETDEDENGEAYFASEYVTKKDDYSLAIRISLDKVRARILFTDKSGLDTDCVPTPGLLLIRKDAPQ